MENELQRMKELLDGIKQNIKTPNPIQDVNLFSILGMENKEVSAHSAFLYYVLKPFSGQNEKPDDEHLRLLLNCLRTSQIENSGYSFIPEALDYADIYREYATDFGRLDFLIVFGKDGKQDAAVIELKIWAGEQPEQIPRYRAFMNKNGYSENNIFFLTPAPRESQTGNSQNITLKNTIRPLLLEIRQKREKESDAYAEVLDQYIRIIDKLTGDSFMLEGMELLKTRMDIQAVDKLNNAKRQVLSDLIEQFLDQISAGLTENGQWNMGDGYPTLTYKPNAEQKRKEYIDRFYQYGSCYPALCFRVDDEYIKYLKPPLRDSLKKELKPKKTEQETGTVEQCLYFFIEISSYPYAGFTPRIDGGIELLKNAGGYIDEPETTFLKSVGAKKTTKWFWDWEEISSEKPFRISFTDYLEGILMLIDSKRVDALVFDQKKIDAIIESIKTVFKRQCDMFFEGIK